MTESNPGFFARLSLALGTFLRLLGDGAYARRVAQLSTSTTLELPLLSHMEEVTRPETPEAKSRDLSPAEQLLALLQREGRFVDFIQQDIAAFADADVGAAARVVHQGCRRALANVFTLEPIRGEAEGNPITLAAGFDPKSIRLVGNVQGQPPYRGTLRHRGWRVTHLTLEEPLAQADLTVIAPAEVEL